MSKVSDEFHKFYHGHHDEIAKTHATMKDHFEEGTPEHTHHKDKHATHVAARNYHKRMLEKTAGDEMNKAAGDSVPAYLEDAVKAVFLKMFGNVLQPTAVSAVAPNRPGITAVPRGGQPEIPAKPNVDPRFEHLTKIDDREDPPSVM